MADRGDLYHDANYVSPHFVILAPSQGLGFIGWSYLSYNLNSFKGGYIGGYIGDQYKGYSGGYQEFRL